MSKQQAAFKAAKEMAEWLAKKRALASGRVTMSLGEDVGKAGGRKSLVKEAKDILEQSKAKAKWWKGQPFKIRDGVNELPRPDQTLGLYDAKSLLEGDLKNVNRAVPQNIAGGLRKIVKQEGDPKTTWGYTTRNEEQPRLRKVMGRWEPKYVPGSLHAYEVAYPSPDELGLVINARAVKTPQGLLHTNAHEVQHLMRNQAKSGKRGLGPERGPATVAQELRKGRPELGTDISQHYKWSDNPSEMRAEQYAQYMFGTPARHENNVRPYLGWKNLENRTTGLDLRTGWLQEAPALRKSSGRADLATPEKKFSDPNSIRSRNQFNRAMEFPELDERATANSIAAAKYGLPQRKAVPGRAVEDAQIRHDAQVMLDHARATIGNKDYSELVRRIKPVLNDRLPGLRYGIAAGGTAGLSELQRARDTAREKR